MMELMESTMMRARELHRLDLLDEAAQARRAAELKSRPSRCWRLPRGSTVIASLRGWVGRVGRNRPPVLDSGWPLHQR
jgi:hypothetical protein